jgi:integration host factor subunit beta
MAAWSFHPRCDPIWEGSRSLPPRLDLSGKSVFASIENALNKEDRVEIRGFGSFKVKAYRRYQGRNPKTGEIIQVKDKKLPFFKVGKELKERVNSG